MRKVTLAFAALAMSLTTFAANPLAESTVWSTGGTWASRIELNNFTANKLATYAFGQVTGVTEISMPDYFDYPDASKKVHIVFPDGSTQDNYPTLVTGQKDADENLITNAFRFRIAEYGANAPGEYVCTIPAGCMTLDGVANEETVVTFIVNDTRTFTPTDFNFEVSPDPLITQTSITGVRLLYEWNWPDGTRRYAPETPNPTVKAYFEGPDGNRIEAITTNIAATTGYGAVSINPLVAITEAGTYTLVIPQDALRFKETPQGSSTVALVCNKALSYQFTIGGGNQYPAIDVQPIISPAPGVVARLSKIEFEQPEGYEMYLPDEVLPISITFPNGTVKNLKPYTNENVEGEYAWLLLGDDYTDVGTYTFAVPKGCFEYFVGTTPFVNNAFTFEYELKSVVEVDMPCTVTPTDGSKLYMLDEVYVKFGDDYPVTFSTGTKAELTRPDGTTKACSISYSATNNRLLVGCGYNPSYDQLPEEFGEYKLVIPASTVMNEAGEVNKEITLNYTVLQRLPEEIDFAIDPEEGKVERLYIIEFTALDAVDLQRVIGGPATLQFRYPDGEVRKVMMKSTTSKVRYRIDLEEPITADGDYALVIPENTFRVYRNDGSQCINAQKIFTWTIDSNGVDGIESEDGLYDVYTTSGVKVFEKATRNEIRSLRGFYVVNGKTYLLF